MPRCLNDSIQESPWFFIKYSVLGFQHEDFLGVLSLQIFWRFVVDLQC